MVISGVLFVIILAFLFFSDRGGCGCLLIILALLGAITLV